MIILLLLLFHLLLPQYVTFKVHISAAAGALCILNAQCRTVFQLKDVHLIDKCCPVSLFEVKDMSYN